MDHLNDQDMGLILEEIEARKRLERKDIANCSPTYKGCWTQWKSVTLRDGILEGRWESPTDNLK
jgi:hypothetical protein